ncbi:MAG: chemotaxis protein CheX [Smithella sp.]
MNVIYINAFVEASINVLKVMASINATAGKPYLKQDLTARGDFSGILTFSGSVAGSLALSFSLSCISQILSNMLGEDQLSTEMIENAAGELTNMISGDARKRLQSQGLLIYADIPIVLSGKNHLIKHVLDGASIAIPFETGYGEFVVDVNIKEVK